MLKSTDNTYSREQFVLLREARALIEEQFQTRFSLQSEHIERDVYEYAVRSKSNELFRLFSRLNDLSEEPLPKPLNEEQFILLREAKTLISLEFGDELELEDLSVFDRLYDYALFSKTEALFDSYRYLLTREGGGTGNRVSGAYFLHLRELIPIIETEHGPIVPATHDEVVAVLARAPADSRLAEMGSSLKAWKAPQATGTTLVFSELSAPDFERLRDAKLAIKDEFEESYSLHTADALDGLYDLALRSESDTLFQLFCDLRTTQVRTGTTSIPADWISPEQFALLQQARAHISQEFGDNIALRNPELQDVLYQYSLQAADESLFGLCRDFHDSFADGQQGKTLPSKEEFRLLRSARTRVSDEFSESLSLEADVVEYDLYRYAVSSEQDDLFDLYTELMALPDKLPTRAFDDVPLLLSKEEFVILRQARGLIAEEFDATLALESEDVLDELYRYALEAKAETLFDLHAELNAGAVGVATRADAANKAADQPPAAVEPGQETSSEKVVTQAAPDSPHEQSADLVQSEPNVPKKSWLGRLFSSSQSKSEPQPEPAKEAASADGDEGVAAEIAAAGSRLPEPEVVELTAADLGEDQPAADDKNEADKMHSIARAVQNRKNDGKPVVNLGSDTTGSAVSRPRVSLPPVPARPTEGAQAWYLSTTDGQSRVRLFTELSLSIEGELLLIADEAEPLSAVLSLEEEGPVLTPKVADVKVNNERVSEPRLLELADEITVSGKRVMVEFGGASQKSSSA